MHAGTTTRIDASPESVFDAMADARNETQWNSRIVLAPVIRRDVRKQHASLEALCERRA